MTSTSLEAACVRDRSHSEMAGEARETREAGFYPITLAVRGRRCLIVGGGGVAARKAASLLAAGADVVVVAPVLGPALEEERRAGEAGWAWRPRGFEAGDVAGCLLAVAATDDAAVNREVAVAARQAGALVNVVDDPEASDFLVPSLLERGALQVAVSTGGRAPAVSAALRRHLEAGFSAEWAEVVELLGQVRDLLRDAGWDAEERRRLNRELAALDLVSLVESGGADAVRRSVEGRVGRLAP